MQRSGDRGADALRPVRITRGYLKHAHGSCLIELGDTRVLCAAMMSDSVAGWRRGSGLGWITAEYSLLPASTHTRTRREVSLGAPGGRTHEIQRLIGRSLRSVVDMGGMGGEFTLNVDCDVIQADGGTRTAAITGAYIAVYDAFSTWRDAGKIKEIPLLDAVAATSVGMVDGVELLDLDYSEDSNAEIDMNVVVDGQGRFIEVQGTGERTPFDRARLDGLLDLALVGTGRLVELQRRVIAENLETLDERW
ncbi:MAG: ribonuclease PH [Actinobacteria bacterium HGW-Actinobacteria-1]|jgi:ribonuclease PH|nr:MAG: ribonuclease PH [Actinobacteria bacterium HGW-Actinobacteria-1]